MKKKLFAAIVSLGCTFALFAEGPTLQDTHREAAEGLLKACKFDQSIETLAENLVESTKQMNPEMAKNEKELREFYQNCLCVETLREESIKLYMEVFTESELKEIAAFYATPVGQKTVEKMPEIMQRCMQLGQARVMQNLGGLEEIFSQDSKD